MLSVACVGSQACGDPMFRSKDTKTCGEKHEMGALSRHTQPCLSSMSVAEMRLECGPETLKFKALQQGLAR